MLAVPDAVVHTKWCRRRSAENREAQLHGCERQAIADSDADFEAVNVMGEREPARRKVLHSFGAPCRSRLMGELAWP